MQFGILYEMQRPFEGKNIDWNTLYKETLEQCELADRVGFDNLWFVEHHFLTGFSASPCPEVMFGALSQRTKRIRIGFGVSILPYHHPVRVAERVAMVDQLTNGRVEVGTAFGAAAATEHVAQRRPCRPPACRAGCRRRRVERAPLYMTAHSRRGDRSRWGSSSACP